MQSAPGRIHGFPDPRTARLGFHTGGGGNRGAAVPGHEEPMADNDILLETGSLLPLLDSRIRTALACGSLLPIETEQEVVEDGGVRFLVRVVSSLERKEADRRLAATAAHVRGPDPADRGSSDRPRPANPFLPPEPALTVAPVSGTHLAVLNKFNVLPRHLLLVTRRFVPQEALLDIDDFRALLACLAELDGLGFYNGGRTAGASQPHKHLQLVPLPFGEPAPGRPRVPMETLLAGRGPRCPDLPFPHSYRRLEGPMGSNPEHAPRLHALYMEMLEEIAIRGLWHHGAVRQSAPYNLLVTRDWMLAVPRSQELCCGVSINALGFAGSLFVKERGQLERIRREGPMRILAAVA